MESDVLIIGSGPAGMSAAFFLSENRDLRITVIERLNDPQYQRYHRICGGGISKRAFKELKGMKPSGILNEFSRTRLVWPDGTEIIMRTPGYILDRLTFLTDLKDVCKSRGVSFIKGTVTDISYDEEYIITTSSGDRFSSHWLIGADGCHSIVRKRLFGSNPVRRIPATEFTVSGKAVDDLEIRICSDGSGTYTWRFPHGNDTGTGGTKGYSEDEYVMKGSRMIPIGGVGRIVSGRAMLIGDAAAMANPISFGGIRSALTSGKKAAESILSEKPEKLQRWWDSSILSDRRFMECNETLRKWSEEEMVDAVRPFRHGGIILPGIWACISRPRNIRMYFGCLFAFMYGW